MNAYQDTFLCTREPEADDNSATFSFIYRRQSGLEPVAQLWDSLGWRMGGIPEQEASLVALVAYTPLEITADADLRQSDINGLLAYYCKGAVLFTEAYAVRGDSLLKDGFLSAESNFLATNDIRDIAGLLSPAQPAHTAVAWIDFQKLPKKSRRLSVLQQHITDKIQK